MNNFKSQGQTFEEVLVNLSEDGIFVEDPFFKQHMENIRKQRELGLEFDMEKAKKVVGGACDFDCDSPQAVRRVILDMDQLRAVYGAKTEVQADQLVDMITMLPPHTAADGEFVSFEVLKGRSSTGRLSYQLLPDLHQMPHLNKTYMPPREGDAFICMENDMDWSRLEELCSQDIQKPKHPLMFKITDLVEDPEEFKRLRDRLEKDEAANLYMGWGKHPIFVEAIPDANIVARASTDTMSQLMRLAREFNVDIYFGTKQALKPVMYAWMYGARKEDLNLSGIDEISVEKAKEFLDRRGKVAIVGGLGIGSSKIAETLSVHYENADVNVESSDVWDLKDFFAAFKAEKPVRDWEQTKLRRGKGHNKFKRKGKK